MENKEEKEIGKGIGFERIRRITGYLTGSVETWNNAKQAELHDRVKHSKENESNVHSEYKERNSTERTQPNR